MPLPKAPFLLGEEDVVPDQAVPHQRGEGALGAMICCLSPELNQQIFSPFFGTKWEEGCAASRRVQRLSACSCIGWTRRPKRGVGLLASPGPAGQGFWGTDWARGEPAPVSADPP